MLVDGSQVNERVILADCCEDWILEWGGFYEAATRFACPECATEWRKSAAQEYLRADGHRFARRSRSGPDASFPYLAAIEGAEPNVDRCCAKIILSYGARMADGPFACPVCGSSWERRGERLHGFRVPVFQKAGDSNPLAIQQGTTRPFLVAVTEYSPPRD